MTVLELLNRLRQRDIRLWAEGDRLCFDAPTDALTPDLRAEIVARKPELLRLLQQAQPTSQDSELQPLPHDGPVPLSFAQERLWFLEQLVPGSALYNMPVAFGLHGPLDIAALQGCLSAMQQRHAAFRTTFCAVDGVPHQVIQPPRAQPVPLIDLEELPAAERSERVQHHLVDEARQPFDLTSDLLLRTTLLRLGPSEHVLLLTTHHIVSDGWSSGILMRELPALYEAFLAGQSSDPAATLPDLPIQYADFAVWQRGWLTDETLEQQLGYWRRQLTDLPVLDLPTDFPRPAVQRFRGALHTFALPLELTQALSRLAQQETASLFMVLLAAWQILLQRYSRQNDIVVGTGVANRTRRELEGMIGFFVNTLVLRTDVSGNPSFRELVARVREVALDAYAHQDVPFAQVVEDLHPARSLSHNPLFQVMFIVQNTPRQDVSVAGLSFDLLDAHTATSKFDLWCSLNEQPDGLQGMLEYNTDLFTPTTIARMVEQFTTLLQAAIADPAQPIARLPLLTEAEQRQQIQWNATDMPYDLDRCLHWLIEEQAARTPDTIAVSFEDTSLSYRELNERANQLAHHLCSLGVGPDTPVGICIERSLDLVVGLLAILKAGGAYVPLDPSYPQERLAFLIGDAQVPVLITSAALAERLPEHRATLVRLDADWPQIATQPERPPASGVQPNNLAYIIYTSGSTGQPKGAMIDHRAIVNRLLWMQDTYQLTADDRVLQKTPYSFDVSVWEFFWPLLVGATLVVARPDGHKDPEYLIDVINRARITTIHFVPSMLQSFVDARGVASCRSLRRVICSGEALPPELQQRCFAWLSAELHNLYGPTEAAVDVTWWPCERNGSRRTVPIGRPIANTQIWVLDATLNRVPVGVPGELYIGGVQLARGYSNRPALTAERFIPDPFSQMPGARLYKTGDLVRYAPDGAIEYLGRIDHQVKLRGFRIELGEIEAALRDDALVQDAVVLVREAAEHAAGAYPDKQLIAYVVPGEHAVPDSPNQEQPENQAGEIQRADLVREQVTQWQMVFDTTYSTLTEESSAALNIAGWNSSYTGQPIPAIEMQEWVDQTVERIRALQPQRVLEIGCGTGLLLLRLAPACESYIGVDVSGVALAGIQAQIDEPDRGLANVTLLQQAADDLHSLADQTFDTVIINSVVQYFPSIEYLLRVLEGAVEVVAPGGCIFVGDVRNLALLEAFHSVAQVLQAPPTLPVRQLRQRVRQQILSDQELVIDPDFFYALPQHLPGIERVEVRLKQGRFHNEMTSFRYDVWLHVGTAAPATSAPSWVDWQAEALTVAALRERLQTVRPTVLGLTRIPNARLWAAHTIVAALEQPDASASSLRAVLDADRPATVADPYELWALSDQLPYDIEITWSATGGADGTMDVICVRRELDALPGQINISAAFPRQIERLQPWTSYASSPLRATLSTMLVPHLRQRLSARLPEYMIPSSFVFLDALPLSANGKLDRQALPDPDGARPVLDAAFVAPRTPIEQTLAGIWSEILGLDRIGVHDNFFALGGDSLRSIRMIAKANQAGISLRPQQVFQHQTIAELATAVDTGSAVQAEQDPVTGPVPLILAQHWFFEQAFHQPDFWQVPDIIEVPQTITIEIVQTIMRHLLLQHDALRARFSRDESGWHQWIAEPSDDVAVATIDLSSLPRDQQRLAIEQQITELRMDMDLLVGPLFRVALFNLGPDQPKRLLTIAHHLVTDGRSSEILFEDALTLYRQIVRGEPLRLPAKTTSLKQWGERLIAYAGSEEMRQELAYWRSLPWHTFIPMPLDFPGRQHLNTSVFFQKVRYTLGAAETQALIQDLPEIAGVHFLDILVTALTRAYGQWTGQPTLLIGRVNHGREPIFDDIDLTRTVGWFTLNKSPALIDLEPTDTPDQALQKTAAQLRRIRHNGLGYDVLRYLSPDPAVVEELRALPVPRVTVYYAPFGATDLAPDVPFRPADERTGDGQSPLDPKHYYVFFIIAHTQDRIRLTWEYFSTLHRRSSIERFAQDTLYELGLILDQYRVIDGDSELLDRHYPLEFG